MKKVKENEPEVENQKKNDDLVFSFTIMDDKDKKIDNLTNFFKILKILHSLDPVVILFITPHQWYFYLYTKSQQHVCHIYLRKSFFSHYFVSFKENEQKKLTLCFSTEALKKLTDLTLTNERNPTLKIVKRKVLKGMEFVSFYLIRSEESTHMPIALFNYDMEFIADYFNPIGAYLKLNNLRFIKSIGELKNGKRLTFCLDKTKILMKNEEMEKVFTKDTFTYSNCTNKSYDVVCDCIGFERCVSKLDFVYYLNFYFPENIDQTFPPMSVCFSLQSDKEEELDEKEFEIEDDDPPEIKIRKLKTHMEKFKMYGKIFCCQKIPED